jgi:hypothetical protein
MGDQTDKNGDKEDAVFAVFYSRPPMFFEVRASSREALLEKISALDRKFASVTAA